MQTLFSPDAVAESDVATRLCGIASGTRLLTPHGYRAVETLLAGDRVRVLLRGTPRFEPITWVGRRDVILSERHHAERPVRIRKDAVADGVPARDVYLAPEHAIYLTERLFMSRLLVNKASILVEQAWKSTTYWGIMLERHNILLAEDLPIESLLSTHTRHFLAASENAPSTNPAPEPPRGACIDLETESRAALNRLSPTLAKYGTRVEFAMERQLMARFQAEAFQRIVTLMMDYAVTSASGGRLLLAGAKQGGGVLMTVSFEQPTPDLDIHRANLRGAQEAAAMHGARLDVDVAPGVGIMMSLRLIGA